MFVRKDNIWVFFFKQRTAYEVLSGLVGSEMCIKDRFSTEATTHRLESTAVRDYST